MKFPLVNRAEYEALRERVAGLEQALATLTSQQATLAKLSTTVREIERKQERPTRPRTWSQTKAALGQNY